MALQVSHDNQENEVGAGRIRVDASGLAAFAKVRWPENCVVETVESAVCDVPAFVGTEPVTAAVLGVRALEGAGAGAEGVLRYTASAGGMESYPGETRVVLGDGPDLALSQSPRRDGVAPGSRITVPATLANNGNRTAQGALLRLFASRGLGFVERPANCEYLDTEVGTEALCVLDEPIAPGDSFALANPLKVRKNALYDRYDYSVEPYSAEALEAARAGRTFTPGTGAELNLVTAPALRTATAAGTAKTGARTAVEAPVPDLDPQDNYRSVIVHAANTADLRLRGSRVEGAVGATVRAEVTVKNRGPAWIASLGAGEPAATVDVRVPAGTTVTAKPDSCSALSEGGEWLEQQLGAPRYRCTTPIYLYENASHTFGFDLRIDRAGKSRSTVALDNDQSEPPVRSFDPDLTNNTAAIVVNG
ncbi:hypothetical protein AB0424_08745 [Streptomyces sp. NPDC051180]|uniref:hypothetical protein n=1 Tax=Streptomyces sp. NPDC051180 TaxID=3155797 RepID=UPI00345077CE